MLGLWGAALPARDSNADLRQDLRFGTAEKREAALDQVLAGKGPDAGPDLLGLMDEAQGTVKLKVVRALGLLRERKAVSALSALLGDPSAEFRLAAAKSLGRIADPASAELLVKALSDSDDEVREAAAAALADCDNGSHAHALVDLLKDKNRLVRLAAVDGLGRLGSADALAVLEGQLDDKDPAFQRHVFKAIGSLNTPQATPFLKRGLASKDAYVRSFSAEALSSRPRDPKLEPVLIGLLGDESLAVRIRALEALAAWKSRAAVGSMIKALRASEPTLRWKAAQALGDIGDPKAREALTYVAKNDAEAEIRASAESALQALR